MTSTRSIRVLIELLSSDLRNGAVNDSLDLCRLGAPRGLEFVFCGRLDQTALAEIRHRGGRICKGHSVWLSKKELLAYTVSVGRWVVALKQLRPDVVHLDYCGWGPSLACAAKLCGIPVVGRAGAPYDPRNRANAWIDTYAANCPQHAASLLHSPLAEKVVVTGSLFHVDRLRPPFARVRPIPGRPAERVRFLFLGQLVPRKGIHVLVTAFARLGLDADLLLVGGDWQADGYPQEIQALTTRLGVSNRVFFENHRPDVGALLEDCDVLVLPSLEDARPRAVIEAMYMGRAVVATNVGGIPTLVTHGLTGMLVTPSDPDDLARAMAALVLDSPLRKRLGVSAQERAEADFRPECAADAYRAMYVRLLGRG